MSIVRAFLIASMIASAPIAAFAAETEAPSVDQALIGTATTPAEHANLAKYFRSEAADARKEAESHRSMAKAYTGSKYADRKAMSAHCAKLAADYDSAAKQYDALAAAEEKLAK